MYCFIWLLNTGLTVLLKFYDLIFFSHSVTCKTMWHMFMKIMCFKYAEAVHGKSKQNKNLKPCVIEGN